MEFKEWLIQYEAEVKKQEAIIAEGFKKHSDKQEGVIQKWDTAMKEAEKKILALETEKKEWLDRLSAMEAKMNRPDFGAEKKTRMMTPGQRFIMSDAYQNARDARDYKTESVEIGNLFEKKEVTIERKDDPIAGATRGDLPPDRAPVWSQRESEIIYEPGQRAFDVMALMASSPTASNLIEYFREVWDQTLTQGPGSQHSETHAKNMGSVNFEKHSTPVETIAWWIPASRQVMDDAPQLQSYIDGRLLYGVRGEAERQILFGSGAGGELLGIMNTPNVQTIGAPTGTDTNLDQIRRAIALVRVAEYMATGIVVNPLDYCEIELLKDGDLRYIWVNVNDGGVPRLWRLPVVESTVMQQGEYLLGAFGLGAKVWDRQTASIRVSENYQDFFVRNAIVILAELRLALAVYRPTAFVKGVFDTWASS